MEWKNPFKAHLYPVNVCLESMNRLHKNDFLNWFKFTPSLPCIFPVKANSKIMTRKTAYSLIQSLLY